MMNPFLFYQNNKKEYVARSRTLREFRNEEKVFNPKRETRLSISNNRSSRCTNTNDMKMKFEMGKKIILKQIKKIKKVSDEYMEDYFIFNPKTRTLKKYEHDLYIDDKEIERLVKNNEIEITD